jgi:hypothetical protein
VLSQLGSMLPSFVGDAVSHRLGMSKLNIARAPTQSRLYYAHGTFRVGCVPPTVTHSCLLPTWFSYACHGGFLVLEWITPRFACLQETKIQHITPSKPPPSYLAPSFAYLLSIGKRVVTPITSAEGVDSRSSLKCRRRSCVAHIVCGQRIV